MRDFSKKMRVDFNRRVGWNKQIKENNRMNSID